MLEIKPYSEWSATTDLPDPKSQVKGYSDYVKTAYAKEGQLTKDISDSISAGAIDLLKEKQIISDEMPEEERNKLLVETFAPRQNVDADASRMIDYLGHKDSGIDGAPDPRADVLRKYISAKKFNPAATADLQSAFDDVMSNTALVAEARKASVKNGEFDIAAYTTDKGERRVFTNPELDPSLVRGQLDSYLAAGVIDPEDLLAVNQSLDLTNQGRATVAKLQAFDEFRLLLDEKSKSDPEFKKYLEDSIAEKRMAQQQELRGTGTKVAMGVGDVLLGPITSLAGGLLSGEKAKNQYETLDLSTVLMGDDAIKENFSEATLSQFSDAFLKHQVGIGYRADKPETGYAEDSMGNPMLATGVVANKQKFDATLAAVGITGERAVELDNFRKARLEESAGSIKKLIVESDSEAASAYTAAKAAGKTDGEFVEEWLADPKNYSGFEQRAEQFGMNVLNVAATGLLNIPAVLGNKNATDTLVGINKNMSRREEYARLFGDEFGIGAQVAFAAPQLATDIAAVAAIVSTGTLAAPAVAPLRAASRAATRAASRAASKVALRGIVRGALAGEPAALAQAAIRTGEATSTGFARVAEAVALKYNQILPSAAQFAVTMKSSMGSSYVSIYSQLPDTMSHEEKHKQAFGFAAASGMSEAVLTTALNKFHMGGAETAGLRALGIRDAGDLTWRQSKYLYQTIQNEGKAVTDVAFKKALAKSVTGTFKNFANRAAKGFVDEAFEESFQQAVSIAIEDAALDRRTPMSQKLNQVVNAGLVGGFLGGGVTAISDAMPMRRSAKQEALQARVSVLGDIAKRLSASGSPVTAEMVQRRMDVANAALVKETENNAAVSEKQAQLKTTEKKFAPAKVANGAGVRAEEDRWDDFEGENITAHGFTGIVEVDSDDNAILRFEKPLSTGETHITLGPRYQKVGESVAQGPDMYVLSEDEGNFSAGDMFAYRNGNRYVFPKTPDIVETDLTRDRDGNVVSMMIRGAEHPTSGVKIDVRLSTPYRIKAAAKHYGFDVGSVARVRPEPKAKVGVPRMLKRVAIKGVKAPAAVKVTKVTQANIKQTIAKALASAAAPAPVAPTNGVQIDNIDDIIRDGGGTAKVSQNGRNVNFNQFGVVIDGDSAEVAYVKLDPSERGSGIGLEAYKVLGNALAERGIALRSSGAQYRNGNSLWKKLAKAGLVTQLGGGKFVWKTTKASKAATGAPAPVAPDPVKEEAKVKLKETQAGLEDGTTVFTEDLGTDTDKLLALLADELAPTTAAPDEEVDEEVDEEPAETGLEDQEADSAPVKQVLLAMRAEVGAVPAYKVLMRRNKIENLEKDLDDLPTDELNKLSDLLDTLESKLRENKGALNSKEETRILGVITKLHDRIEYIHRLTISKIQEELQEEQDADAEGDDAAALMAELDGNEDVVEPKVTYFERVELHRLAVGLIREIREGKDSNQQFVTPPDGDDTTGQKLITIAQARATVAEFTNKALEVTNAEFKRGYTDLIKRYETAINTGVQRRTKKLKELIAKANSYGEETGEEDAVLRAAEKPLLEAINEYLSPKKVTSTRIKHDVTGVPDTSTVENNLFAYKEEKELFYELAEEGVAVTNLEEFGRNIVVEKFLQGPLHKDKPVPLFSYLRLENEKFDRRSYVKQKRKLLHEIIYAKYPVITPKADDEVAFVDSKRKYYTTADTRAKIKLPLIVDKKGTPLKGFFTNDSLITTLQRKQGYDVFIDAATIAKHENKRSKFRINKSIAFNPKTGLVTGTRDPVTGDLRYDRDGRDEDKSRKAYNDPKEVRGNNEFVYALGGMKLDKGLEGYALRNAGKPFGYTDADLASRLSEGGKGLPLLDYIKGVQDYFFARKSKNGESKAEYKMRTDLEVPKIVVGQTALNAYIAYYVHVREFAIGQKLLDSVSKQLSLAGQERKEGKLTGKKLEKGNTDTIKDILKKGNLSDQRDLILKVLDESFSGTDDEVASAIGLRFPKLATSDNPRVTMFNYGVSLLSRLLESPKNKKGEDTTESSEGVAQAREDENALDLRAGLRAVGYFVTKFGKGAAKSAREANDLVLASTMEATGEFGGLDNVFNLLTDTGISGTFSVRADFPMQSSVEDDTQIQAHELYYSELHERLVKLVEGNQDLRAAMADLLKLFRIETNGEMESASDILYLLQSSMNGGGQLGMVETKATVSRMSKTPEGERVATLLVELGVIPPVALYNEAGRLVVTPPRIEESDAIAPTRNREVTVEGAKSTAKFAALSTGTLTRNPTEDDLSAEQMAEYASILSNNEDIQAGIARAQDYLNAYFKIRSDVGALGSVLAGNTPTEELIEVSVNDEVDKLREAIAAGFPKDAVMLDLMKQSGAANKVATGVAEGQVAASSIPVIVDMVALGLDAKKEEERQAYSNLAVALAAIDMLADVKAKADENEEVEPDENLSGIPELNRIATKLPALPTSQGSADRPEAVPYPKTDAINLFIERQALKLLPPQKPKPTKAQKKEYALPLGQQVINAVGKTEYAKMLAGIEGQLAEQFAAADAEATTAAVAAAEAAAPTPISVKEQSALIAAYNKSNKASLKAMTPEQRQATAADRAAEEELMLQLTRQEQAQRIKKLNEANAAEQARRAERSAATRANYEELQEKIQARLDYLTEAANIYIKGYQEAESNFVSRPDADAAAAKMRNTIAEEAVAEAERAQNAVPYADADARDAAAEAADAVAAIEEAQREGDPRGITSAIAGSARAELFARNARDAATAAANAAAAAAADAEVALENARLVTYISDDDPLRIRYNEALKTLAGRISSSLVKLLQNPDNGKERARLAEDEKTRDIILKGGVQGIRERIERLAVTQKEKAKVAFDLSQQAQAAATKDIRALTGTGAKAAEEPTSPQLDAFRKKEQKAGEKRVIEFKNPDPRYYSASIISPETIEAARKANNTDAATLGLRSGDIESVISALQLVAKSRDKVLAPLAKMLLSNQALIRSIDFRIVDAAGAAAGWYSLDSNSVTLNLAGHNGSGLANVLVHEFLHAPTARALSYPVSPAEVEANKRVSAIRNLAIQRAQQLNLMGSKIVQDGLSSNHEFVTTLLTSPDFASAMRVATPVGQRTFLQRVIDVIKRLFGFDSPNDLIDQAMTQILDFTEATIVSSNNYSMRNDSFARNQYRNSRAAQQTRDIAMQTMLDDSQELDDLGLDELLVNDIESNDANTFSFSEATVTPEDTANLSSSARDARREEGGGVLPTPAPSPEGELGDLTFFSQAVDGVRTTGSEDRTSFSLPVWGAAENTKKKIKKLGDMLKGNLPKDVKKLLDEWNGSNNLISYNVEMFNKNWSKLRDAAIDSGATAEEIHAVLGTTMPVLNKSDQKAIASQLRSFAQTIPNSMPLSERRELLARKRSEFTEPYFQTSANGFLAKQAEAEQRLRQLGNGKLVDLMVDFRKQMNEDKTKINYEHSNDIYLTRSYKFFTTEGWSKFVMVGGKQMIDGVLVDFDELRAEASKRFYDEIMDEHALAVRLDATTAPMTQQEISELMLTRLDDYLKDLVRRGEESRKTGGLSSLKRDLDRFMKKKDIDVELRGLLGEVTDPFENAVRTARSVGRLAANSKFLKQFTAIALDSGLASLTPTIDSTEMFGNSGDPDLEPLAGLYVRNDIAAALRLEFGSARAEFEANSDRLLTAGGAVVSRIAGIATHVKTKASVGFYPRNVLTGMVQTFMQGIPPSSGIRATKIAWLGSSPFLNEATPEEQAYIRRLIELNMLRDSAFSKGVSDLLRGFSESTDDALQRAINGFIYAEQTKDTSKLSSGAKMVWDRAKKAGIGTDQFLSALNDTIDSAFKINAFEYELKVLKNAYGDTKLQAWLEAEAAEKIKASFPTHSQQFDLIKSFNRTPLSLAVFSFARYKSEVMRNMFNTLPLAMSEIKTKNPVLVRRGVQRALGFAGTIAFGGTVLSTIASAVFKSLVGDEEDDDKLIGEEVPSDQLRVLKNGLPKWQRDHTLYAQLLGNGDLSVINLTNILPHSMAIDLFKLVAKGDVEGGINYLAQDVFGEQIAFSAVTEATQNRNSSGYEIYSEADGTAAKFYKVFMHLGRNMVVPSAILKGRDIIREGEQNSKEMFVGELIGARPRVVPLTDVVRKALREAKRQQNNALDLRDALGSKRLLPQDELDDAVINSQKAINNARVTLKEVMDTARKMGIPDATIYTMANKDAQFSKDTIAAADAGLSIGWFPNAAYYANIKRNVDQGKEESGEARVKRIYDSVKQNMLPRYSISRDDS